MVEKPKTEILNTSEAPRNNQIKKDIITLYKVFFVSILPFNWPLLFVWTL